MARPRRRVRRGRGLEIFFRRPDRSGARARLLGGDVMLEGYSMKRARSVRDEEASDLAHSVDRVAGPQPPPPPVHDDPCARAASRGTICVHYRSNPCCSLSVELGIDDYDFDEPVAPGLEPPPPPPPEPVVTKEESIARAAGEGREFCQQNSRTLLFIRTAVAAAKLALVETDALLGRLYSVPDFAAYARAKASKKEAKAAAS